MKKGFTLIELLVVISIMGVLASILFMSFTGAQKQVRDTQRKSDIGQYQAALEGFANVNADFFPSYTAKISVKDTLCPAIPKNISKCLDDVRRSDDATFVYNYQSNGPGSGTASATRYVIWGKLEYTTDFWVTCSSGQKGYLPLGSESSISGGNCPTLSQTPSGISAGGSGTSTPTTAPTTAPTSAPTSAPTTTPSVAPTTAPTTVPTTAPTSAPTAVPTLAPTLAPTVAPTAPIPASTAYKRVFVTSTLYNGNLGGLSGADQKCLDRANAPGVRLCGGSNCTAGSWKAWLSDNTNTASARLTHSTIPYNLLDGTLVANSWTDLMTVKGFVWPNVPIRKNELMGSNSQLTVWTATKTDGTLVSSTDWFGGTTCNNWTDSSNSNNGVSGISSFNTKGWTEANGSNCGGSYTLYCFEQ